MSPAAPSDVESRFQRDVARMLLTFFAVAVIDLVVVSLITHRLRFWFPVWLDPDWATRAEPWVVYSQSYAAGIFMIPLLCRAIDREVLATTSPALRGAFWATGLSVFGFILWWKGGLMLEHKKHVEALAWLALTAILWTVIRVAEELPKRLEAWSQRRLLGALLFGIACFFLVMSAVDPIVQLEVQRVAWSPGLAIEVGFFVPAGAVLMWISKRLTPPPRPPSSLRKEGGAGAYFPQGCERLAPRSPRLAERGGGPGGWSRVRGA